MGVHAYLPQLLVQIGGVTLAPLSRCLAFHLVVPLHEHRTQELLHLYVMKVSEYLHTIGLILIRRSARNFDIRGC